MVARTLLSWQAEQRAFAARDLPAVGYVYLWADGIHVTIRLAFYDYPAEYGVHLRTTNPIESIFAAVRHRSKITKRAWLAGGGPGDGSQAHRVSPRSVARRQRTSPGRPGPRRSDFHQRKTRRAAGRGPQPEAA